MLFAIGILLLALLLTIIAAMKKRSSYDLIIIVNVSSTIAMMLIALIGFFIDRLIFIDIALIYALINFIVMLALLKYVSLQKATTHAD